MNRAERRKLMKSSNDYKKMHKVVNNLSDEQAKLIETVSNQKTLEKIDNIQGALDIAICAKLIEIIPELNLKEIYSINEEVGNMSAEILIKENELMNSVKGDSKMAKKISLDFKNKVRKESEKLIKAKLSQNKAIEELKKKFSDLPKSLITVTYKEVKEELKIEEQKQVEKGAEKIMNIIDHKEDKLGNLKESIANVGKKAKEFGEKVTSKELPKDLENKIKETAKKAAENIEKMVEDSEEIVEPKEVVPEEVKVTKFKPILMKFEGEFGTYTKDKSVLKIENETETKEYRNLDQINQAEQQNIKQLEQAILKVKACYEEYRQAFEV